VNIAITTSQFSMQYSLYHQCGYWNSSVGNKDEGDNVQTAYPNIRQIIKT